MTTDTARPSFLDSVETNPQPDYSCIVDGQLTDRYRNLADDQRDYILALWRAGEYKLAQRIADCYRIGALYETCKHGKIALGHKYRCGDMACQSCHKPRLRLHRFAESRDHEIFRQPSTAIEFFSIHPDLRKMVKDFIRRHISPDALMTDAIADGELSVRCIVPLASVDRKRLQILWVGRLSVHIEAEPYLWAFSGLQSLMEMTGEEKASWRIRFRNERLIRTIGSFYAPITMPRAVHKPTQCPICKNHDLDYIPESDRHHEQIDELEKRFELVVWGKEKLNRRDLPTNKFLNMAAIAAYDHIEINPPPN